MPAASTPRLSRLAATALRGVSLSVVGAVKPSWLLVSALSSAGAAVAADAPAPAAAPLAAMAAPAAAPRPPAHAASAAHPPGHAPAALPTYLPKRGESLDAVIKKTMADSPLRIELLRQAFVQANAHAFPSGKVGRLPAGVVLHVPDHTQLVRTALMPLLQPGEAYLGGTASASSEERRRWVRFP